MAHSSWNGSSQLQGVCHILNAFSKTGNSSLSASALLLVAVAQLWAQLFHQIFVFFGYLFLQADVCCAILFYKYRMTFQPYLKLVGCMYIKWTLVNSHMHEKGVNSVQCCWLIKYGHRCEAYISIWQQQNNSHVLKKRNGRGRRGCYKVVTLWKPQRLVRS